LQDKWVTTAHPLGMLEHLVSHPSLPCCIRQPAGTLPGGASVGGAKAVSAEEAREARLHYFEKQTTAARQVNGGGRQGPGAIRQAAYRLFKSMSLYFPSLGTNLLQRQQAALAESCSGAVFCCPSDSSAVRFRCISLPARGDVRD
jgi:hypothetical protein